MIRRKESNNSHRSASRRPPLNRGSRRLSLARTRPLLVTANQKPKESLNTLTSRFRRAMGKGVEGILEAGRVLKEAKDTLEHGQYTTWVEDELKFGDVRKAELFSFLSRHEVISNPVYLTRLPPSPRTLWELTRFNPSRLRSLIESGAIHSALTREDAIALKEGGQNRTTRQNPKLKEPNIALLVDACIEIGGADCVLAHIRGLERVAQISPDEQFDNAVFWLKTQLTERRQGVE
jgi:hypothetical protein